jgi:hypothetical protein
VGEGREAHLQTAVRELTMGSLSVPAAVVGSRDLPPSEL